MKVFVIGGGAREHALVWSLSNSSSVDEIVCAPGNPGIAEIAECIDIPLSEDRALVEAARKIAPGLAVVGPEMPLVAGVADRLREAGIQVFGPGSKAARIEGSKSFAKAIMRKSGVATATAVEVESLRDGLAYVDAHPGPLVVKADGLAAGKGVTVCESDDEARTALTEALEARRFGDSGARVLIEERMTGPELSVIAFCDGKTVLPLPAAQDYKRVFDNDAGPNTGGMGAYSPLPFYDAALETEAREAILEPVVAALAEEGEPFVGALFAGLMKTTEGLKVVEFNCRFGDPEAQTLLPRLESDLAELMLACVEGSLAGSAIDVKADACVCVVAASGGYPDAASLPLGLPIRGVGEASDVAGLPVFHAGTSINEGRLVTAGGRVVAVSALGESLGAARDRAYSAMARIEFEGMHYRKDIAAVSA